jgi:glycosyltransferase involved in cell wall biosynthesis
MSENKSSKIAVVVPWEVNREFLFSAELARLSGQTVETLGSNVPRSQNLFNRLFRIYPQYLLVPIRLMLMGRRHEMLIMWQQVYGIGLAILLRIFRVTNFPPLVILTFILTPKKRKGLRLRLIRFALESPVVKRVVVFSAPELSLYKTLLPSVADKFRHTLYTAADVEKINQFPISDENYFLSAGRSNRDYDFLVEFFTANPQLNLVILSDQYSASVPKNIEIIANAFNDDYYKYISRCHAMLLPFNDPLASSGQLVFLHAIQFGKPVIATRSSCLDGYFIDEMHGYIIDKNSTDLSSKIAALNNKKTLDEIARFGVYDYKNRFGFTPLAESVWQISIEK